MGRVLGGAAGALSLAIAASIAPGCSDDGLEVDPSDLASASASVTGGAGGSPTSSSSASGGGTGGEGGMIPVDPGPAVDTSDPQLYKTSFKPEEADAEATAVLATQVGFLDTRVDPRGLLVIYLHGAGKPGTCGSNAHGEVLAGFGFHVFGPCYISDYGVQNCGDDIEGCRLEAFEGVDHHPFVDIKPPDSIEVRVVKGLQFLQSKNPAGDWTYFLDGDKPKWSKIVISGISHGASTSGVIGIHRSVHRVVSLSGPLDSDQAWLKKAPITPIDRFFGFTHTGDDQHAGHLQSFDDMALVGDPTSVDGASPPYGGSHRLITSAPTMDGHGSTQAGNSSPKDGDGKYVFMPVWEYLYVDAP